MTELTTLHQLTHGLQPAAALHRLSEAFPGQVVFSTSFGYEDQVITHLIAENNLPIRLFTLDTGRLFGETYAVYESTRQRYQIPISAFFPKTEAVERLLHEKGPNSFYASADNRKECCHIRKVEPLKRALQGNKVWVTGIRAQQSDGRKNTPALEWDEGNRIIKFHPLLSWTLEEVKQYIAANNIPYNSLHDRGFVSIGCAPCTRAVKPGEDFRAGRWWWENNTGKECGLHEHK